MSDVVMLKVSEIFVSLQGEGLFAGAPSVFLRLATCNLRCSWCDTPYSWDFSRHDYAREVSELEVGEVVRRLPFDADRRLVVTGGEPLLQQVELAELFARLPKELPIDVETNGTVPPSREILDRVQHFAVSVKLVNSGEPASRRLRPKALAALRESGKAWLKLVVQSSADCAEAQALASELAWPKERIFLMPEARTRRELARLAPLVARESLLRGVAASPRLHVELWDGRRGT
jgi:organic radical activating enzyme